MFQGDPQGFGAGIRSSADGDDGHLELLQRTVNNAVVVDAELRNSPVWQAVIGALPARYADIVERLTQISPTDVEAVSKIRSDACALLTIPQTLAELHQAAQNATELLNDSEGAEDDAYAA